MDIKESLKTAITGGIFLILLTPLILGPFGVNMSEYPKAVYFKIVVEVIFGLYVWLVLCDKKYLPKKSYLWIFLFLFYAILFLASIFGVNFYRSFFGGLQRGEGIILHLHLLAFFAIITGVFKEKKDWLWMLKVATITSAISSFASVLQQFNLAFFYMVQRPSGTLSNSDLFGCYIALSIFLAIYVWAAETNPKFKKWWLGIIALDFYALLLSGTRGSWFGLAVGVLILFLFNYSWLSFKKRMALLWTTLGVLAFFLLMFLFPAFFHNLPLNAVTDRITTINLGIGNRMDMAKLSFVALKDRPWLGWGNESFSYVYDKYIKVALKASVYYDRPHNKVVEIFVYCGILGFLAYILMFLAPFYLLFKNYKKFFSSILAAFFVAYFVQNIASFDNICTYILFFIALGLVVVDFSSQQESVLAQSKIQPKLSFGKKVVLAAVFVAIFWLAFQLNLKPTLASMCFPRSFPYERTDFTQAYQGYKRALAFNTIYDYDLRLTFVDRTIFFLENGLFGSNVKEPVAYLATLRPVLYKMMLSNDEQKNNLYQHIARIDEWKYRIFKDPSNLAEMESILKEAVSFNPNIPAFYQLYGELNILQNKDEEGAQFIKKGCSIDKEECPNEAMFYKRLGIAYYKKGDYKQAIKNFQTVIDLDCQNRKDGKGPMMPGADQFVNSVALMYYRDFNDLDSCTKVYKKAMEAYPEYADIFRQRLQMIISDYASKK